MGSALIVEFRPNQVQLAAVERNCAYDRCRNDEQDHAQIQAVANKAMPVSASQNATVSVWPMIATCSFS
jgi:hypothetical protein